MNSSRFFIAAILSMRQNPYVVFAGAIAALALMTCLSVAIGWLVPTLMSKVALGADVKTWTETTYDVQTF